jgi:hypothetical protein
MKLTDLILQMIDLLPTDNKPGTTFLAIFLLHLPSKMRNQLITKDFKDCTGTFIAEYADLQQPGSLLRRYCQPQV